MDAAAISICEVGPRDGLQNERTVLEPQVRGELCRRLAAVGLRRIEAVSFVRDDLVPTMAGAEEVLAHARTGSDVLLAALVLNERGYERAVAAGVEEVHYALPVTHASAERNQSTTVAAATDLALDLLDRSKRDGVRCTVALAVAFGCPFEGSVAPELVLEIAERILVADPHELFLADSIGVGVPRQVRELVGALAGAGRTIGCHFHNTRNTGYANALAAVESGATVLDASLGGLGGCPFMPGATGNIATEDLVYLLEGMGYRTGINLDGLRACSAWLAEQVGHELPSLVARAGDPCGIVKGDGASPDSTQVETITGHAGPLDPLQVRAARGEGVSERVAAELLACGIGEFPGDGGVGDNGKRFDGGDVAALDERLRRVAGREVDGVGRPHQRG